VTKTSPKTSAKRRPTGKRAQTAQVRTRRPAPHAVRAVRRGRSSGPVWTVAGVVATVIAVLLALFLIYQGAQENQNTAGTTGSGSGFRHVEGQPGAGATAPGFTLASTTGGQVSLADYRGTSVLLYFQEGLMCQPCWDQIRDLEQNQADLTSAGVDAVVSITTDPIDQITRKVADEKLSTPVLSDPDLAVSRAYTANQYGMMGTSRDGHSFILVGPDGTIHWRADYGGKPAYTMFLPTDKMLLDLRAERRP
jgi:peroxiredoxin